MSDDDKKNDLTRIEDLSEFLHQGDEEIDKLLADIDVEDEDSNFEDDSNNSDEGEITLSSFEYETPTTDLSEQDDVEELEASDFEEGSFDDGFFQNEDDEENEDIGELDEQDTADINLEFSAVEDLGQEGHDEEDSDDDVDDVDAWLAKQEDAARADYDENFDPVDEFGFEDSAELDVFLASAD